MATLSSEDVQQIERRVMLDADAKKELDDIQAIVRKLDKDKQDRIPLFAWLIIIGWAFGATWYGATTLTSIAKTQETLVMTVRDMGNDRYYGKDALKDSQIQSQKDQIQDEKINRNTQAIHELFERITK